EDHTATRAGLGRVGGIYQDDLATGAFSLVRETAQQVGPARVQDAHREAPACHRGHAEVFEHDPIESLYQLISELIEEILPRVGDADHEALQVSHGLAAVRAARRLAGDRPLDDPEPAQDPAIPARVLDLFAVGECGEPVEADIDADRLPRG